MENVFKKLTAYTLTLQEALATTTEANERQLITHRLAAAAQMYARLHEKGERSAIRELVQSEVRAYGWSFIPGRRGEDIAEKWLPFTQAIGTDEQDA